VVLAVGAAIIAAGAITVLVARGGSSDSGLAARRAAVEARGATVMPFDQNRTTHIFDKTSDGGVQTVTANDPSDATQIRLVREHLQQEAKRFAAGNFDDPAKIHGMNMPGLAPLRGRASEIQVGYTPRPDGGRITYTTSDPTLVTALHEWFDAQLMDHGAHARG
jgi:hypothetical protein